MAQYFTDFSEHSVGDGLAQIDWSEPWNAFSTVAVEDDAGTNVLRLTGPASDGRCALSWDEIDADANRATVETLSLFDDLGTGAARGFRAASRVSGSSGTETGWTLGQQNETNHRISNYDGGTFSDTANTAFTMQGGSWWLRTQSNGTAHKAKIWADGSSEPGTWTLETTDTAVQTAGSVGLFLFNSDADVRVRQIGVGTNGDTAPHEAAGGQTVAIGQATETSTAQSLTSLREVAVAQASESSTAQTLTWTRAATLGQASETDTAQVLTWSKDLAIGQASETDTAQSASAVKTVGVNQASETSTAIALDGAHKEAAVGQASETSTAQGVTATQSLGQATETDTAQSMSAGGQTVAIGQATEQSLALPLNSEEDQFIDKVWTG